MKFRKYDERKTSGINWLTWLLSDLEAQAHFAAIGTTGSGKTLALRLLMQSVLPDVGQGNGVRALVYDAKGDAMSQLAAYCDSELLLSLNPFDERGLAWDIAADVNELRIAIETAYTLITGGNESQPHFVNASRHICIGIMASFMLSKFVWTFGDLMRGCMSRRNAKRILARHAETESIVDAYFRDARLCNDIFSTLATKLLPFSTIAGSWEAASEMISIRDWIESESILILGNSELSRVPIDAINRTIFKLVTHHALSKPERTSDRTWFFVDELSEAGKLEGLVSLLKKGRSKGVRAVLAFQTISGLRNPDLYGQYLTDEVLGQIGNRFLARVEDPETSEYMSRLIGDQEYIQRSSTSGADGQGHNTNSASFSPVIRCAILPSEFSAIPPADIENGLHGYVTIRGHGTRQFHIKPQFLFGEALVPPVAEIPEFVPRDPSTQFLRPWTPAELAQFATKLVDSRRERRSQSPKQRPTPKRRFIDDDPQF